MFDEEYRDEHDECRHEIELLNQRIDRLVSAFKQCRADLALSSGTWSNAASFGLQPEDIGLKRIDEDSPTPETPADLVGALQDKVHADSGPFRTGRAVKETFPSPPISPWPSSQQFDCLKCANGQTLTYMIVCPTCGNKRCPKASDHDLDCTHSNAPGQPGSQF